MKHSLLRTVSMVLILAMMALICACNGSEQENTTGTTQTPTQTTVVPTTALPTTVPPTTVPPTTVPPTTVPPTTVPPTTVPVETEPPTTAPTELEPTETEPEPTQTKPTEPEPTETEPPAPVNDIGKEIAKDGFAIKVLSVEQSGKQYVVILTLTYSGDEAHALNAKERFFVVDSDRRSIAVDDIFDTDGNSLLGSSIQPGQTMTIKAIFTLKDGFVPNAFRYVYDIMGFRRLQAQL